MELAGSPASLIETIRFQRFPGECDSGKMHDCYQIRWTDASGMHHSNHVFWCPSPFCAPSMSNWRLRDSPPVVVLVSWVNDASGRHIANAYLLVKEDPNGARLPKMYARIGICDQWKDRSTGNYSEPGEPRKTFSERYFGDVGPGVYPAEIQLPPHTESHPTGIKPNDLLPREYCTQLNDVLDAYKQTVGEGLLLAEHNTPVLRVERYLPE